MKIGFKPKSYNDVICFEMDDEHIDKDRFMSEIFSFISLSSEEELDFVVTVTGKKPNEDEYVIPKDENK